jgi:hypothetical protein
MKKKASGFAAAAAVTTAFGLMATGSAMADSAELKDESKSTTSSQADMCVMQIFGEVAATMQGTKGAILEGSIENLNSVIEACEAQTGSSSKVFKGAETLKIDLGDVTLKFD